MLRRVCLLLSLFFLLTTSVWAGGFQTKTLILTDFSGVTFFQSGVTPLSGASTFVFGIGDASGNTPFAVALVGGDNLFEVHGDGLAVFECNADKMALRIYEDGRSEYMSIGISAGGSLNFFDDDGDIPFVITDGAPNGALNLGSDGRLDVAGHGLEFGDNTGIMFGAWTDTYGIGISASKVYYLTSALGKHTFYQGTAADASRYFELGSSGASAFVFGTGDASGNTPFAVGLTTGETRFVVDGVGGLWIVGGQSVFVSATDNKLYFSDSAGVDHALH